MPAIPPFVLKKLYVNGSLRTEKDGFGLDLRNSVAPALITAFVGIDVDDREFDPAQITLVLPGGESRAASHISVKSPLSLSLNTTITLRVAAKVLEPGPHRLTIHIVVHEVGPLEIPITDTLA